MQNPSYRSISWQDACRQCALYLDYLFFFYIYIPASPFELRELQGKPLIPAHACSSSTCCAAYEFHDPICLRRRKREFTQDQNFTEVQYVDITPLCVHRGIIGIAQDWTSWKKKKKQATPTWIIKPGDISLHRHRRCASGASVEVVEIHPFFAGKPIKHCCDLLMREVLMGH